MTFQPTTIPPTPTQIANQIISQAAQLQNLLTTKYTNIYNLVWNNPKATPTDIVNALGTQAVSVFTASADLAAYLIGLGANVPTTVPSGVTATYNNDGTVTI